MGIELDPKQIKAVNQLKNGCILCGGVGSGKSRTALAYYFCRQCEGGVRLNGQGKYSKMKKPLPLYIITTARKRDTLEWERECIPFLLKDIHVDSWNNIKKYKDVENAFFIFDEQRVTGYGPWTKAFIAITKRNKWILLSATPGDVWMDYVPVFVANGYYKNKTDFVRRHVVYKQFSKYPQVDRYINTGILNKYRRELLVDIDYVKPTISHNVDICTNYDKEAYKSLMRDRWNVFKNQPIVNIAELCYLLRRITNSDESRSQAVLDVFKKHSKIIIFYSFDYELDILKSLNYGKDTKIAEWNGHIHEPLPESEKWVYLVNYFSGAEGWNCIETDTMIFFSQTYSYKTLIQAAGRIDRRNTPFTDLYYYHLKSKAPIDIAISRALKKKKTFNESRFIKK